MNGMVIFILTCVCINALTSYPVQILAAFNVIERFEIFKDKRNESKFHKTLKKMLIRIIVIATTTLVTFLITTFTDFINIAGALGSLTVAFILPELFYLKVFGHQMSTW
jgi:amino acid permease